MIDVERGFLTPDAQMFRTQIGQGAKMIEIQADGAAVSTADLVDDQKDPVIEKNRFTPDCRNTSRLATTMQRGQVSRRPVLQDQRVPD